MYQTPDGRWVSEHHTGPKVKVFDGEGEWERYLFLLEHEKAGRVRDLRPHRVFSLHSIDGSEITTYESDFEYWLDGVRVVEDFKSPRTRATRLYQIKKKWMLAEYGITITEIDAR